MSKKNYFLSIHYSNMDFYINRSQFFASVTPDILGKRKKAIPYFQEIIQYGEEKILLFDLDQFLCRHFKTEKKDSSLLCIITDTKNYSKESQSILKQSLRKDKQSFSPHLIACLLPSSLEIKNISLSNLKLLSSYFFSCLYQHGIAACSFIEKKIIYFIDLEKIMITALQEKNGALL
ncbi:MAG TPA: hypothetical protein DHW82_05035 [Spirochaetia bacterium]|nr:hypothetical protein [Spirochaetia bacterium]